MLIKAKGIVSHKHVKVLCDDPGEPVQDKLGLGGGSMNHCAGNIVAAAQHKDMPHGGTGATCRNCADLDDGIAGQRHPREDAIQRLCECSHTLFPSLAGARPGSRSPRRHQVIPETVNTFFYIDLVQPFGSITKGWDDDRGSRLPHHPFLKKTSRFFS